MVIGLTFWEQNPEHVSTVTLACIRELEKACVMFSGSLKHPRYVTVLPGGRNGFLVRNGVRGCWCLPVTREVGGFRS